MDAIYRFGGFTLDPVRRLLFGPDGRPISLKSRVLDTLVVLVEHRGALVEKQTLLAAVWPNVVVEENNLNQAISTLRRVFGERRGDHAFIVTEPGRGYRFVARVDVVAGQPSAPVPAVLRVPGSQGAGRAPFRGAVAIAALALVTSAAATFVWLNPEAASRQPEAEPPLGALVRVTQLTFDPGAELAPALSPDGENVVFSLEGEDGTRDLYVRRIGGGTMRLTATPEPESFPAWSPNGAQIAFLRQRGQHAFGLIVVPALGGRETEVRPVLLRPRDIYGSPPISWTPGGDGLLFTTRSGDGVASAHHIHRLTLDTGKTVRLTAGENVYDTSPALSPDGRSLAFVRHVDFLSHARGTLLIQPLRDGAPAGEPFAVPVPSAGAETLGDAVHSPSWSKDGRYLTFVAGADLLEWEVGAAEPRQVWAGGGYLGGVTGAGDIAALTLVRNGERARAVVARIDGNLDIFSLPLDPATREAAGPPTPRYVTTAVDSHPDVSPDGRRVAFVSRRDGRPDVWIAGPGDDAPWRRTDRNARTLGFPRWSRDSARLSFHDTVEPQRRNVYVMDAEAGVPLRVGPGCCAEWSEDGEHLYATEIGAEHVLWRVRVADGYRERLFVGGFARLTADASMLLYTKLGERNLYARRLDPDPRANPEETLVTDSDHPSAAVPVADGIYYVGYAAPGEPTAIRFYDYATRQSRTVATLAHRPFETMSVSPDGTELLYGAQSASTADLVMVEFGSSSR